jgi:hypothetical protein
MSKPLRFIHVDTLNGIEYSSDSSNNSFVFISGTRSYSPNDYNIIARLPHPLSGVKKIYLKSFSTTVLFPTIRSASNSHFINVVCNGTTKRITLVDKIYTSITTLITDLNTSATALFPGQNILFSIDSYTGNVMVASSSFATITVLDSNLAFILGFRSAINTNGTNYCTASYLYNLAMDSFLYLYISNISTISSPNCNRINCSFKIPINTGSYNVNYSSTNLNFEEYIEITNPNMPISELRIQIVDRWGANIHSAGAPLALSFAMEG